MQTGDGFIFNLDTPRELPGRESTELGGWIAALQPVTAVHFLGALERDLALLSRPDVATAFPAYPHAIGFSGQVSGADLRNHALTFAFEPGGEFRQIAIALPAPPRPAQGWRRLLARTEAGWARRQLRGHPSTATRWKEGLRLLLAEARLRRGNAFDRATGDRVLRHFAQTFPAASVVQIGANDGQSGDFLARWFEAAQWSGLLVEPIPHLADALARRYSDRPAIRVERAAISDHDGEATIHRIAEQPGDPTWYQQLATLDRDVLLKHRDLIPSLEDRVIQESVPALSIPSLLARHRIAALDLLVIDTEGFDWRILRQFDLSRYRPKLIVFEHQHLPPADKAAAYALLRRHGYRHAEMPEGDAMGWLL